MDDGTTIAPADPILTFVNLNMVTSEGIEIEGEYIDASGLRLRASHSITDVTDSTGSKLTNSPENITKVNATLPVFDDKAVAGIELQGLSDRITPLGKVAGYAITNLTLSSQKVFAGVDLSFSIYNVFDKRYSDPASEEHVQNGIAQDERNFRVKASYSF